MLEKMAGEAITNVFTPIPVVGSNPPIIKKKRNLPGTPGNNLLLLKSKFYYCFLYVCSFYGYEYIHIDLYVCG